MDDELSALPPEGLLKRSSRVRASSLNPRYANPSPATSAPRAESPTGLRHLAAINTDAKHPDEPVILSPTPRRHLIESSASLHWLHSPLLSPFSSRHSSPQRMTFPTFASSSSSPVKRRRFSRQSQSFSTLVEIETHQTKEPEAMGRRWIRWMHARSMKQWIVPGIIAVSVLFKFAIGIGSYSGHGTPPMFGDYEAQRHWMELTIHLPFSKWYTYDLSYWGLDYPPLTAYLSWLCGIIAHWINPAWVALDKSRGIETPNSKVFMRSSVVVMDTLVYVPALLMFSRTWQGSRSKRTQELSFLTLIFQPALLLIDFGHFQYNSVMLGLTLFSINFFATGQDLLGAFFFVLSLGFKQMALYYAPAIGSYLIAKCLYLGPTKGFELFTHLAAITISTFLFLFLPWLPPLAPLSSISQPIIRIFPFARGLFEDKVANFWCASNVIFKWKAWGSPSHLVKISTAFTALGFLPSVIGLIRSGWKMSSQTGRKEPTPFLPLLPYALLNASMSFFLFSFQVHEKSILLPLMPVTLLLSGAPIDSAVYSWGALVNNVVVFSMWPLLKRDGLGIQYIAMLLLWNRLIGYNPLRLRPESLVELLSMGVYSAAFILHVLEFIISPPAKYPDLYPVLNVLISTPVFISTWVWSIKCGVEVSWAMSGLGSNTSRKVRLTGSESTDTSGSNPASTSQNIGLTGFRQAGRRVSSLGSSFAQASSSSRRAKESSVGLGEN